MWKDSILLVVQFEMPRNFSAPVHSSCGGSVACSFLGSAIKADHTDLESYVTRRLLLTHIVQDISAEVQNAGFRFKE